MKNSWDMAFDHVRLDFNVKGIIIYNSNVFCTRISFVGYPFIRSEAINDNEVKR